MRDRCHSKGPLAPVVDIELLGRTRNPASQSQDQRKGFRRGSHGIHLMEDHFLARATIHSVLVEKRLFFACILEYRR